MVVVVSPTTKIAGEYSFVPTIDSCGNEQHPGLLSDGNAMTMRLWWACVEVQACLVENQLAGLVADAQSYVTAEGDNITIVQKTCRDLVFQLGTWW